MEINQIDLFIVNENLSEKIRCQKVLLTLHNQERLRGLIDDNTISIFVFY